MDKKNDIFRGLAWQSIGIACFLFLGFAYKKLGIDESFSFKNCEIIWIVWGFAGPLGIGPLLIGISLICKESSRAYCLILADLLIAPTWIVIFIRMGVLGMFS